MKFFSKAKDGGPKSTVTGYWLIELKNFFSIVLLRFDDGSRDELHSHAFSSFNWVLSGGVVEKLIDGTVKAYLPSFFPVWTRRKTFHKVVSFGTTWVLSIRGPWSKTWKEFDPRTGETVTLSHGRKIV